MDIQQQLLDAALKNPVIQGLLIKAVYDAVKQALQKVDDSGVAVQSESWLHPASVVLALLVTAVNLALSGHLASLDLSSLTPIIQNLIQVYLGTKAAGTLHLRSLVNKVKLHVSRARS